jgi:hypothetical protein
MEDKKVKAGPDSSGDRAAKLNDRSVSAEEFSKAHQQADKDIEADAEFSAHSPNDDLDEGETARLGEKTGLI